jgi:hypothetical protein
LRVAETVSNSPDGGGRPENRALIDREVTLCRHSTHVV